MELYNKMGKPYVHEIKDPAILCDTCKTPLININYVNKSFKMIMANRTTNIDAPNLECIVVGDVQNIVFSTREGRPAFGFLLITEEEENVQTVVFDDDALDLVATWLCADIFCNNCLVYLGVCVDVEHDHPLLIKNRRLLEDGLLPLSTNFFILVNERITRPPSSDLVS